jgi:hypothetical protein
VDELLSECGVVEVSTTSEVVEDSLDVIGTEIPLGYDRARFAGRELSCAEPLQEIALSDFSLDRPARVVLVSVVRVLKIFGLVLPGRPPVWRRFGLLCSLDRCPAEQRNHGGETLAGLRGTIDRLLNLSRCGDRS